MITRKEPANPGLLDWGRRRMRHRMRRLWSRLGGHPSGLDIAGIVGRVHPGDTMCDHQTAAGVENYSRAGQSALDNMTAGLQTAGRNFACLRSCLDMGCGYGRVLRLLCQQIAPAKITACDLDAEAVQFCASEFGVQPLLSSPRLEALVLGSYDLIWVGSLLTHLVPEDCDLLLAKLGQALLPGGLLVLSFHGRASREHLDQLYGGAYAEQAEAIRTEVESRGIAYRPYPDTYLSYAADRYGMTWHSAKFVESRLSELGEGKIQQIALFPQGWDNHHDVVVLIRRS